jgi:glutamyl-Q tRNA(Asp) synthetase
LRRYAKFANFNLTVTTTRFAPSPTGLLHLGHAYAAKVAHDLAAGAGGTFRMRFEDIDRNRVGGEFYAAIEEDLQWLGLDWFGTPLRQSDRLPAHDQALDQLRDLGILYPCFCTRREIQDEVARIGSAPHGPEGPLYPGSCRKMSAKEREDRLAAGQNPAWRLDATLASERSGPLGFNDLRHGKIAVDPQLLGDVVLARRDIGTSYHLAVVVDDAHQRITHVTRGEDLLPSTHVHRILQALLDLPEPAYLHHPLITDESGRRLATRDKDRTIRSLREAGESPDTILSGFPRPI